ncbi:MAG TPA: MFS transporter [Pyrinomonadaceae bacterium]|nr:MFS transporter [Pyrinomonadaceae bacterium]
MASLTYMQLLRGNRSFRWLWSGQVVSELGNWFNFIAGLGLIRSVSAAAPEATAIMLVALLAPFALFAPLAGAFADRWSRRTVMIAADLGRAVIALGYLLVKGPEDLWIAYVCAVVGSLLSCFFEAAKNAAMPNVTSADGLLAGNALMFSSRFLLMSLGAALGGWASARFGYQTAFVINAASFLVSAYSVWKIPAGAMREEPVDEAGKTRARGEGAEAVKRASYWADVREGWKYIARYPLVAAIIGINVLWATGGGACNLIYDRLGGVAFAGQGGLEPDAAVAVLYASVGAGAFVGMFFARRVGYHVELHGLTVRFIGWMLFAHGVIFALAGLMPKLWMTGALLFLSRFIVGMEFAVQDTLLQRLVPDQLRGRVITTDRASEILVMTVSTVIAAWSLHLINVRTLAVISGLLSATPGLIWLALFAAGKLSMPAKPGPKPERQEDEKEALLASAG